MLYEVITQRRARRLPAAQRIHVVPVSGRHYRRDRLPDVSVCSGRPICHGARADAVAQWALRGRSGLYGVHRDLVGRAHTESLIRLIPARPPRSAAATSGFV